MAAPIPFDAPVTTATLPVSFPISLPSLSFSSNISTIIKVDARSALSIQPPCEEKMKTKRSLETARIGEISPKQPLRGRKTDKLKGCDFYGNNRKRDRKSHPPQGRLRLARLPKKPRRLRGHDGPAPPQRSRAHPQRRRRRDHRHQHLQLHRLRQAGVRQHHPRDGSAQAAERRQSPAHRSRRLPRRALPRRDPEEHPRSR